MHIPGAMASQRIRRVVRALKRGIDRVKFGVEGRFDLFDEIRVLPFRSWGTTRSLRVQGRVIEAKGLDRPRPESGFFDNATNTMRRLDSDEMPGALLEVSFRGRTETLRTDDEGFFRIDIESDLPLEPGWHRVRIRLIESVAGPSDETVAAEVRVPDPNASFIVISDIDDTVMVTNVNEGLEMLRNFVARNVHTREPFPGVPAFYRALVRGTSDAENTIVYVTRTGWNFYDLVVDFLDLRDIPHGPMLMRDLALLETHAAALETDEQKLSKIAEIMESFPDDRFVLIGDSGQADPEIYAECVSRFGARVAAVYIRKAGKIDVRQDTVRALEAHGAALCVTASTVEMARHAAAHGLIARERVDQVIAESTEESRE